jgi:Flp pilus assembly protein TadG
MRRLRGRLANQGQALIEFALIIPILILLVIGLFDLGTAVYTRNVIANAAREGARTGIILGNNYSAVRTQVQRTAPGLSSSNLRIDILPALESQREFSKPITVTVTYTYTAITPLIGRIVGNGGRLPLTATSSMIVEGVTQTGP